MKKRFLPAVFFLFVFLFAGGILFASGRAEEAAGAPVNKEWVLCITAPDVSGMSLVHRIKGDTVSRNIVRTLQGLNFRLRDDKEAEYYEDYAWTTSKAAAARALSAKRNERDLEAFRGDRPWLYRKRVKGIDDAILKLEEELARIEASAPVAERRPAFRLADANRNGNFPRPPEEGGEYLFCTSQRADAFVLTTLSEYHGRTYLNIKMYTLYTRSFTFDDSVLFSSDDLAAAMEEILSRLASAVSAVNQAGIVVHVSPAEAMLIIDGSFTGQGETHSHLPGTVEVDVRADNYLPVSLPVELRAGEIAELFIELTPMGMAAFDVNVPGRPGSKVFIGSHYVGETPLSLELPRQEYVYISVETPEGEVGSIIYRDDAIVRGSAQFVWTDGGARADFTTRPPVSAGEKRVDRARRGFYISYGVFWFVLPASLLAAGYARSYVESNINPSLYTGVYYGAQAVWGTALAVTISQIIRYLYVSGRDATPMIPVPKKEEEQ